MNNVSTFACFADLTEAEFWEYRRIMTDRFCATTHLAGLSDDVRMQKVWEFEKATFDIVRKHKKEIIKAGYSETRGDHILTQPSGVDCKIVIFITQGDIVLPTPDPGDVPLESDVNDKTKGKKDG